MAALVSRVQRYHRAKVQGKTPMILAVGRNISYRARRWLRQSLADRSR
jgi:hypothetical protein